MLQEPVGVEVGASNHRQERLVLRLGTRPCAPALEAVGPIRGLARRACMKGRARLRDGFGVDAELGEKTAELGGGGELDEQVTRAGVPVAAYGRASREPPDLGAVRHAAKLGKSALRSKKAAPMVTIGTGAA